MSIRDLVKKKYRRHQIVVAALLCFIAVLPLGVKAAVGDGIQATIFGVLAWGIYGIVLFLSRFTVWLVGFLVSIGQYNGFISSPVVLQGWVVLRDISNMFFVLILLLIAFGTILHIEQYQMKRLLPKVLLMAILVNFSKAIAGLLIDFSQVIMLTFVAAYQAAGAGNLAQAMHLDKILAIKTQDSGLFDEAAAETLVALLLALVYIVVASVVVGAFAVILVIRMVMLWLLIIFSPLAYVLSVVPIGQKYASQWWDNFAKYVILGPVMAFFLWLSLATLPTLVTSDADLAVRTQSSSTATLAAEKDQVKAIGISEIGSGSVMSGFLISIVMLFASLMFAMQTGGVVGQIAGSAYGQLLSKGTTLAKVPLGLASWGERKVARMTGGATAFLNPFRVARAWRGYAAHKAGREEAEIGYRAGSAASAHFAAGRGVRGALRLIGGAHEDAFETYMGLHGIKRFARTITGRSKTGTNDFLEAKRLQQEADIERETFNAATDKGRQDKIRQIGREHYADEFRTQIMDEEVTRVQALRQSGTATDKSNPYTSRKEINDEGKQETVSLKDAADKAGIDLTDNQSSATQAFLREWDEDNARRDLGKRPGGLEGRVSALVAEKSDVEILDRGKSTLGEKLKAQESYVKDLMAGGLSSSEKATRAQQEKTMDEELRRITAALQTASGIEQQSLNALKTTLEKERNSGRFNKDAEGNYVLTKEERDENKGKVENFNDPRWADYAKAMTEQKKLYGMSLDPADAAQKLEIDRAKAKADSIMASRKEPDIAPRPYFAEQAFRHLESEETSKLPREAMEYDEIDALLKDALHEGNIVKTSALMKKAAKDGNDNEIWNSFGYGSGPEGAEQFRKTKLVPLMGDQASMSLMSELNYINEDIGHTNTTRSYGVRNGSYYKKSAAEQAASAAWEVTKRQSRNFLQNTNRLGFGYEDTEGKFHLDLTGKLIISSMQNDMLYRLNRKEFNNNLLLKLLEDVDSLDDMVRRGLLRRDLVDNMKSLGREHVRRGVPNSPGGFESMARQFSVS